MPFRHSCGEEAHTHPLVKQRWAWFGSKQLCWGLSNFFCSFKLILNKRHLPKRALGSVYDRIIDLVRDSLFSSEVISPMQSPNGISKGLALMGCQHETETNTSFLQRASCKCKRGEERKWSSRRAINSLQNAAVKLLLLVSITNAAVHTGVSSKTDNLFTCRTLQGITTFYRECVFLTGWCCLFGTLR